VKVFLNLPEILGDIDRIAARIGQPVAFYLGKLQDGLTLDPLTGYSRQLVPFFAEHPYATMRLLTKSTNIGDLLDLEHHQHSIFSWTVNPPEIADIFERNRPPVPDRVAAMRRCADARYPTRRTELPGHHGTGRGPQCQLCRWHAENRLAGVRLAVRGAAHLGARLGIGRRDRLLLLHRFQHEVVDFDGSPLLQEVDVHDEASLGVTG
jgi:hypothetical protein